MTAAARGAEEAVDAFERSRPRLLGLAYRMTGGLADAEDVVQEAWLRWQAVEWGTIERPEAWLTTVTARIALDRLRAVRSRREDYVGPWLPEPVVVSPGPEESAELAETLTLGFLTLLERLGPVVAPSSYSSTCSACPTPMSLRWWTSPRRRADRLPAGHGEACEWAIHAHRPRRNAALSTNSIAAVLAGDVDAALARLAPDAVLVSDGGPTRRAARRPVVGAGKVRDCSSI